MCGEWNIHTRVVFLDTSCWFLLQQTSRQIIFSSAAQCFKRERGTRPSPVMCISAGESRCVCDCENEPGAATSTNNWFLLIETLECVQTAKLRYKCCGDKLHVITEWDKWHKVKTDRTVQGWLWCFSRTLRNVRVCVYFLGTSASFHIPKFILVPKLNFSP